MNTRQEGCIRRGPPSPPIPVDHDAILGNHPKLRPSTAQSVRKSTKPEVRLLPLMRALYTPAIGMIPSPTLGRPYLRHMGDGRSLSSPWGRGWLSSSLGPPVSPFPPSARLDWFLLQSAATCRYISGAVRTTIEGHVLRTR